MSEPLSLVKATLSDPVASADGAPMLVLPGGIGLYRHDARLTLDLADGRGFTAGVEWQCSVRLGGGDDALLGKILGAGAKSEPFRLAVQWDSQHGLVLGGSGALELSLPVASKTPLVQLQAIHLSARPKLGAEVALVIGLTADVSGQVGSVLQASVQGIGVNVTWRTEPAGADGADGTALGPFGHLSLSAAAPKGAGLAVDVAGIISGGGAVRYFADRGQYAGVLQLRLLGIGVTAMGIVSTRPAFSFFAALAADFRPVGMELSFGFTLNAVGGVLGLNCGMDLGALADGVRSNALASLMFPADPIADAPRILADLERFFPSTPGHFVVGPMLELGWGKPTGMFSLSVGVVIEIPGPKLALLGTLRVLVPPVGEAALLRLQVNFVGSVDLSARFLRFDASLFDSRLALFRLEGDMAARLRWGADANFAVAVGGFHPGYQTAGDLELPAMRRVSISMLGGNFPRVRLDAYFALTSNTLQAGARIEAAAMVGSFGIRGWLGFDVLAQASPLRLVVDAGGQVEAIAFGEPVFSVGFALHIEGPSPWNVAGEASFRVLLAKARIPVRFTVGLAEAPAVPGVNVEDKLREQIGLARNWRAPLPGPDRLLVRLRDDLQAASDRVLAHPAAGLAFEQHALPLACRLDRFGAAIPLGPRRFDLLRLEVGGEALSSQPTTAEFARGQFQDLPDEKRLSSPAFEAFSNGLAATPSALARFPKAVSRCIAYEQGVFDKEALAATRSRWLKLAVRTSVAGADLAQALKGSAVARSPLYAGRVQEQSTAAHIERVKPAYAVVDTRTLDIVGDALATHAQAEQARDAATARLRGGSEHLAVMSLAEIAGA